MNDKNDATTCSRRTSLATVHVLHTCTTVCSMCVYMMHHMNDMCTHIYMYYVYTHTSE